MKYYKMITGTEFIGAINSNNFVAENPINGWLLTSNEISGQFVSYKGQLYRDYWMQPIITERNFIIINIIEITEEEYQTLIEAIDNNEPIIIEEPEDETPTSVEDETDITVEYVRAAKITEMSATCRRTIEGGFDLDLRGETHHFSLTTQDQLNLMSISVMAQTQDLIPYHADGEESTFYTAEEINQVIAAATSFKNYNLSYYNALKAYINSLDTIEAIAAITYGTPIPDEYKSDVLMVLE